jgi:hypothetical protein
MVNNKQALLVQPGTQVTKGKKPFKSGSMVNTVTGVIEHHILGVPAYIFQEDDSYVEVRRCKPVLP